MLLCVAASQPQVVGALEYSRAAILHGEAWRLWSAHLTHFGAAHLAADALAMALVLLAAGVAMGAGRAAPLAAALAPGISLALLLVPDLSIYRGASALAYAIATAVVVFLARSEPRLRPLLALVSVLTAGKLAWDAVGPGGGTGILPDGVTLAWQAHVAGVVLGACAGLFLPRA